MHLALPVRNGTRPKTGVWNGTRPKTGLQMVNVISAIQGHPRDGTRPKTGLRMVNLISAIVRAASLELVEALYSARTWRKMRLTDCRTRPNLAQDSDSPSAVPGTDVWCGCDSPGAVHGRDARKIVTRGALYPARM